MTKPGGGVCYMGVSWHPVHQKYHARIIHGKKTIHIGYYVDQVKAAIAYDDKVMQLHGFDCDSRLLNFPERRMDMANPQNPKVPSKEELLGETPGGQMAQQTSNRFAELEKRVREWVARKKGIQPAMVAPELIAMIIQLIMSVIGGCFQARRSAKQMVDVVRSQPIRSRVAFWLRAHTLDWKEVGFTPGWAVDCCQDTASSADEDDVAQLLDETVDVRV